MATNTSQTGLDIKKITEYINFLDKKYQIENLLENINISFYKIMLELCRIIDFKTTTFTYNPNSNPNELSNLLYKMAKDSYRKNNKNIGITERNLNYIETLQKFRQNIEQSTNEISNIIQQLPNSNTQNSDCQFKIDKQNLLINLDKKISSISINKNQSFLAYISSLLNFYTYNIKKDLLLKELKLCLY